MEIINEIKIDKPVEDVFSFLANFENMSKWNYYILKVIKNTEGPISNGTVFHQTRLNDSQDYKIVEFDYLQDLSIETLPPERYLTRRFTFSSLGDSTLLTDKWQIDASSIIAFFVKKRMTSAVNDNLKKLKVLLETGETTLQDGRIERL